MGQRHSFGLSFVPGNGWANKEIPLYAPPTATFGGGGAHGGFATVDACYTANPDWAVGTGKEYLCLNGSVLNSGDTAWFVSGPDCKYS